MADGTIIVVDVIEGATVTADVTDTGITTDVGLGQTVTSNVASTTIVGEVAAGARGLAGLDGSGVRRYRQEVTGDLDGVNDTFVAPEAFQVGTTVVFLNGLMEDGYAEELPSTIIFDDAPLPGDVIRVDYTRSE